MNTRINAKLLFTYSVFLLIISFISIFFYLKFKRIDNVFKVSVREYELIVKINKLKVRYFGANDFANLKKSELDELNREIIDIRRTVEELSLKEKNFREFYRNITENNLIYGDVYSFIEFTETTLNNLYNLHLREMDYINRTIAVFIFISVGFGIILMLFFSYYISSPIVRMRKALKKDISSVDISELENIRTGDEIEYLAREFSILVEELRKSREKLENQNLNLEKELAAKMEHINEINKRIYHSKKLSALGSLVAGIAHEIKNPLNVMSNILYNLRTEERESLDIVMEQISRIDKLVSGFLDYARIEKYNKTNTDILKCIENVVSFFRKATPDINIVFEKNTDNIMYYADGEKIEQAILNLFVNSKDALENKENGKIYIYAGKEQEKIFIVFRDNGKGIDKETSDRIFDPFFTTKRKGTGLGLSMVYNVVRMHNGNISVKSEKDEFTEFRIVFGGNDNE